jgi:hypothetical protein
MERSMSPSDTLLRAEAAEAALERASKILGELDNVLAQSRRLRADARAHLRALDRGDLDALSQAKAETMQ